jgi:FAD dependent oxidoreductase TIGR03364
VTEPYDLAVVGAGIVGLAHAYAAARLGKRVVVIERNGRAVGASIRNFGFITVTGQAAGDTWRRSRRSRDLWAALAPEAEIAIEHEGLLLAMRRPESVSVAEAFLKTEMGEECALLDRAELLRRWPQAEPTNTLGALWSPIEVRVESRDAIPRLTAWLHARWWSIRPGYAPHEGRSRRKRRSSVPATISSPCFQTLSPSTRSPSAGSACCGWRTPAIACPPR